MILSIGVVGASGYAGAELLRILAGHPAMRVVVAAAHRNAGQAICGLYPNLRSYGSMQFCEVDTAELATCDLVFIALPHGASAAITAQLPASLKVVDLGADHRLADPQMWRAYYDDSSPAPAWTYGLPELPGRAAAISAATQVANPGCYATAIQLAGAPLLAAGVVEPQDIVAVAASGTSGAGRSEKVGLSASEVMSSMSAYKVGGVHPHTAEICQEFSLAANSAASLSFTPTLAPMPRGILATVTLRSGEASTSDSLREILQRAYENEPFISVLPAGQWPSTASTFGTNCAHVQVAQDDLVGRAVVVCAIDNLGKGAAGQAVQNANLMCGLDPTAGLARDGVAP